METETKTESEPSSNLSLPLYSLPTKSSHPSGMLTPPIRSTASVPFHWEEAPGKPRPLPIRASSARCLELPPRLLLEMKITNSSSPTTVLEGPYMGRSTSRSSSFSRVYHKSFSSPERGFLDSIVHSKRENIERGKWSSWGRKKALKGDNNKQVSEGSFSNSSPFKENGGEISSTNVKITRFTRNKSFLGFSRTRSHLWGNIQESLEKMVPWRRRKSNKKVI